MERIKHVQLNFSDAGCPLFQPGKGARLLIQVHEGGTAPVGEIRHVELAGNKQGLIDLAAAIMSLAESTEPDHHLHLDDLYERVIDSPQGFCVIVAKLPERRAKPS
jgi:hypothetical protein